jgi:hypothetical protein
MTRRSSRRSSRGKVDKEHWLIRDGLRAAGYFVVDTSAFGADFPDLLAVSKAGTIVLLEVKTDGEYPTEGQVRLLMRFPGPISLAFSIEQALEVMARYD